MVHKECWRNIRFVVFFNLLGVLIPIDEQSLNSGIDKYCLDTIGTWYENDVLQQIYRLGKDIFVNKDVQKLFKISDQGARNKIKAWEDMQIVKKKGTTPSDSGGKPVTLYEVADPRIVRIINKELDPAVGFSDLSEEDWTISRNLWFMHC